MKSTETRIFPLNSLSSDYTIVSMPKTAWYWLDDLVSKEYPDGYKSLMRLFKKSDCVDALSQNLRTKAQEHCEKQMAEIYNLANDNIPSKGYSDLKRNPAYPLEPDLSARMPMVYRLFHFMPHATYLTTVWERRNYHFRDEE